MRTAKILAILVLVSSIVGNATANWITSGDDIYADIIGNVGIGTTSPTEKLTVIGSISEPDYIGIYGYGSTGIYGEGYYQSILGPESGTGVVGKGFSTGVRGIAGGRSGKGISGIASGEEGFGVYGAATDTGEFTNYGGYFISDGRNGIGVYGYASYTGDDRRGANNYGGYFVGEGPNRQIMMGGPTGIGIYAKGNRLAGDFDGPVRIEGYTSIIGNLIISKRVSDTEIEIIIKLGEGMDYAEGFDVSKASKIIPGSVLVIDSDNPGKLKLSDSSYDTKVAGIVAGAKGLESGIRLGSEQFDCNVALAGRVYCNVDATESEVQPGDLLTTSTEQGYAMKVVDYTRAQGAILGKAMEKLEKGNKGQILVLVTLQ